MYKKALFLDTALNIGKYLSVERKQVRNISEFLPIFGIGETRFRYTTTTKLLDFAQDRIKDITNNEFNSFKELVESSQVKILSERNLYKKKSKGAMTIAFNNLKGGVAKTTTVVNLASILASLNQKVLLVDMDMQNQLSDHFTNEDYTGKSILQIVEEYSRTKEVDMKLLEKTIVTIDVGNNKTVDLLPSEWDFGRGLESARSTTNVSTLLKKILHNIKEKYDFILIDTPPTNVLALELSFFASDYITFVTNAERKSYQSFEYLIKQMEKLQSDAKEFSLDIKFDTVILNKYKETLSTKGWLDMTMELSNEKNLKLYQIPLREFFALADSENTALIAMSGKRKELFETIEELIDYAIDLINRA